MIRYGSRLTLLFLSAVAITASGCGPRFTFVPVEGTVTKNGRPLANVKVVFLADPDSDTVGPRATGQTDAAGHYHLRTDHGDDGAVPGTHRVLVLDLDAVKNPFMQSRSGQRPPDNTPSRVSATYGSINETRLRATVGSEPLVFDITIP